MAHDIEDIDINKIPTASDLAEGSLQIAIDKLFPFSTDLSKDLSESVLITNHKYRLTAGRLANKFGIGRIIAMPDWIAPDMDAWLLCGHYEAFGSPGA